MSEQLQIAISAVQRIELEKQRWRNRAELAEMENENLQAKLEKLSQRQKADEEAFWEERDARVEIESQVERLESIIRSRDTDAHEKTCAYWMSAGVFDCNCNLGQAKAEGGSDD